MFLRAERQNKFNNALAATRHDDDENDENKKPHSNLESIYTLHSSYPVATTITVLYTRVQQPVHVNTENHYTCSTSEHNKRKKNIEREKPIAKITYASVFSGHFKTLRRAAAGYLWYVGLTTSKQPVVNWGVSLKS